MKPRSLGNTPKDRLLDYLYKSLETLYVSGGADRVRAWNHIKDNFACFVDVDTRIGSIFFELLSIKHGRTLNKVGMTNIVKAEHIAGQILKNLTKFDAWRDNET